MASPDRHVGAPCLTPQRGYYRYKASRMRLISCVLEARAQALLDEYVRRTGLRQHLAAPAG
ncbi:hypothetical protein [Piscinibacter sakaiensis]|uniref:hypothetical protein n=1 Tax=Piscinibacter sakaiensis TaxID=1547922 RepID=UPI003AACBAF7